MEPKPVNAMLRNLVFVSFLCVLSIAPLAGCDVFGSDEEPEEPTEVETDGPVAPEDAEALTRVLEIPGARLLEGAPPPPSNETAAPRAALLVEEINSSNGSTVQIPFSFNGSEAVAGYYVQVVGAGAYFDVPVGGSFSSNDRALLPIRIPANVVAGSFVVSYCVYDRSGRVSNAVLTRVIVLRLGTGNLQISLSWDTVADIDLWVTDPANVKIFYRRTNSPSGGSLDRDDVDGFGPENIFWNRAPDGEYVVQVDFFNGPTFPPTNYVVTVTAPGITRTFEGQLSDRDETDQVTRVIKSGDQITFQ